MLRSHIHVLSLIAWFPGGNNVVCKSAFSFSPVVVWPPTSLMPFNVSFSAIQFGIILSRFEIPSILTAWTGALSYVPPSRCCHRYWPHILTGPSYSNGINVQIFHDFCLPIFTGIMRGHRGLVRFTISLRVNRLINTVLVFTSTESTSASIRLFSGVCKVLTTPHSESKELENTVVGKSHWVSITHLA